MPIELGIWRISDGLERVHFSSLETEAKLESVLYKDISVLDPGLMLIGRQVPTAYGKIIDLLAIDSQGDLTVLELKRNKTPRDVVAQVLDYASWVRDLSYEQVTNIYAERNSGKQFEQAFAERFQADPPERVNESHRLVIIASELDSSTERIIGYLSENYGVPINAVFFRYFRTDGNEYLARTWLIDPMEAEAQTSKAPAQKGSKEPWNGRDYYVSLGEGEHRDWEDCRRYGFVSAGGGRWYTATLEMLKPGARVFACIPQTGYVGVGTVTESAVPISEFRVKLDGTERPILELPLKAANMGEFAGDPERSEYAVRVEWEKTVPAELAVWEKGMFANQNSACKLRNGFTLERLAERFGLED
jgi:hypothetical protein